MYAVIETGGKQYRVEEGQTLRVERLPGQEEGETFTFDRVLFIGGDVIHAGTPAVEGASVKARLVREDLDKKVMVFRRKRRKGFRRLRGHRQPFAEVRIEQIVAPGASKGSNKQKASSEDDEG